MPSISRLFSSRVTQVSRGTSGGMVSMSIDADDALRSLRQFVKRIREFAVPNKEISEDMYDWVQANFDSDGNMQRPHWAPLAPGTIAQKQRLGYPLSPLIRTGGLRDSFRPFHSKNEAGVGSSSNIARFHEDGTRKMPRRSMLPPVGYVRDRSVRIYNQFIEDTKQESGL